MTADFQKNLDGLLEERSSLYSNEPFLYYTKDDRKFTYHEFLERVHHVSGLIRGLGIGKGDVVSLVSQNSPEFIFSYLGTMRLGAIANPLNYDDDVNSLASKINHSSAKCVFVDKLCLSKFERVSPKIGTHSLISMDSDTNYDILERNRPVHITSDENVLSDDPAEIIYTSGTTSRPKGCTLTHRNILTDVKGIVERLELDNYARMLCISPLFHVSAQIISFLSPLYSGGVVVLSERFSAHKFWGDVDKYNITITNVVPTILVNLVNRNAFEFNQHNSRSLAHVLCGAAPLPVEILNTFEEKFGIKILETYGLTETTCVASANSPKSGGRKKGSVGYPLAINEMAIHCEDGSELPPYEVGEIAIKGDNVFTGYLKAPSETSEALRNGWFYSGDLGYRDIDGYFFVTGRKKDVINRGGEKISPREVEEILYANPMVRSVVAVGVKDAKHGEHVGVAVELKLDIQMNDEIREEINKYCKSLLAEFKCPQEIFTFHELGLNGVPQGPSGKVLRREVQEKFSSYLLRSNK